MLVAPEARACSPSLTPSAPNQTAADAGPCVPPSVRPTNSALTQLRRATSSGCSPSMPRMLSACASSAARSACGSPPAQKEVPAPSASSAPAARALRDRTAASSAPSLDMRSSLGEERMACSPGMSCPVMASSSSLSLFLRLRRGVRQGHACSVKGMHPYMGGAVSKGRQWPWIKPVLPLPSPKETEVNAG